MFAGSIGEHDVGGLEIDEKIVDRKYSYWEREVHALLVFLVRKHHLTVDELRRAVEGLEPDMYKNLTYYERWTAALCSLLLERGIITRREIEPEEEPRTLGSDILFQVGDTVRVKPESTVRRWRKPHLRIPGYIHGAIGKVEAVRGFFEDPAYVAFRDPAPQQPLYTVRFPLSDVWGAKSSSADEDSIDLDIFQPWLESVLADLVLEDSTRAHFPELPNEAGGCQNPASGHVHGHDHDHDHKHDSRSDVEQRAVDAEGEELPLQPLANLLITSLEQRRIVTRAELRAIVDGLDTPRERGYGAILVARAWVDSEFKSRLLADASSAAAEMGIQSSNYARPSAGQDGDLSFHPSQRKHALGETVFRVVENTADVHNLVVCTLCSCYPVAILGLSPDWYKSRTYRARAVREPRNLLRDFGLNLPASTVLRVHDSTAEMRYMVLPARPDGTEGWDEERLRGIITRDCLIGVAVPCT